jgi:phospholipid-transporting ATPase
MLVFCMFWYGFYSNFSGVFLYEVIIFQCYNILFTFFPIFFYGIFDQQFDRKVLLKNPILYKAGMECQLYNNKNFMLNFFNSLIHSGIIVLFPILCLCSTFTHPTSGQLLSLPQTGQFIFFLLILISSLKVLSFSHSLNPLQLLCLLSSFLSYYLVLYHSCEYWE